MDGVLEVACGDGRLVRGIAAGAADAVPAGRARGEEMELEAAAFDVALLSWPPG
jgi:hypothetical protein